MGSDFTEKTKIFQRFPYKVAFLLFWAFDTFFDRFYPHYFSAAQYLWLQPADKYTFWWWWGCIIHPLVKWWSRWSTSNWWLLTLRCGDCHRFATLSSCCLFIAWFVVDGDYFIFCLIFNGRVLFWLYVSIYDSYIQAPEWCSRRKVISFEAQLITYLCWIWA